MKTEEEYNNAEDLKYLRIRFLHDIIENGLPDNFRDIEITDDDSEMAICVSFRVGY